MSSGLSGKTDAEMLSYSANFSSKVSDDPTAVGETVASAAALATLQAAYADKLVLATEPDTRTKVTVHDKRVAREALENSLKAMTKRIDGNPNVSDSQRISIGIPIRKAAEPVGVPTTAPVGSIVKVVNKTIFAKFTGQGVEGGGRPEGCESVLVFSYIGNEPLPDNIADWTYQGSTTTTKAEITMGADVPAGAKVYLTACWQNPRRACGPLSTPIYAYLAGGPVNQVA
jgi:hypothetical protein